MRQIGLALLHLADVVIGDQPLAARQRRDRIDHRAAVGPVKLARGNVAGPDLGEAGGDVALPFRVRHVVDALVPVDVHQRAKMAAGRDVLRRHLPDLVEGAVDRLGPELGVHQHDAHRHAVDRALQVGKQVLAAVLRARQLLLAPLQVGDVGADADRAAVVGADLAVHAEAAVAEGEHGFPLVLLAPVGQHLPQQRLRGSAAGQDDAALQRGRHHRLEADAGTDDVLQAGIHVDHGVVEEHERVVAVVVAERVVHRVERGHQPLGVAAAALGVVYQFLAALAQRQRAARLAQLVERLDHRRDVAAAAAIAGEGAVLVEAREARDADISAVLAGLGDLVDEVAERPQRLQVGDVHLVFAVAPRRVREEVEPRLAHRPRRLQPGRRLDPAGEMGEMMPRVGLPGPVGADLHELLQLGRAEPPLAVHRRGCGSVVRHARARHHRPVRGRCSPNAGRCQFTKPPAGFGSPHCRTSIND